MINAEAPSSSSGSHSIGKVWRFNANGLARANNGRGSWGAAARMLIRPASVGEHGATAGLSIAATHSARRGRIAAEQHVEEVPAHHGVDSRSVRNCTGACGALVSMTMPHSGSMLVGAMA